MEHAGWLTLRSTTRAWYLLPVLQRGTLAVLVLVTIARVWWLEWHPRVPNPNEATRVYLTRAIVDDRQLSIDEQVDRFGLVEDHASRNGRFYSDKAPGLSLLGVGPYGLARLFVAELDLAGTRHLLWATVVALPSSCFLFLLAAALSLRRCRSFFDTIARRARAR